MSQFSGKITTVSRKFHGNKGVMRDRRAQKRAEAEARQAEHLRRVSSEIEAKRVLSLPNADLDVVD